jgi:hypothetical protein
VHQLGGQLPSIVAHPWVVATARRVSGLQVLAGEGKKILDTMKKLAGTVLEDCI